VPPRLISFVEAVEKVAKRILGEVQKKNDLTECSTIIDLMLGRGQVTPENHPIRPLGDFFYRLVISNRISFSF
jgi:hypothetical protein